MEMLPAHSGCFRFGPACLLGRSATAREAAQDASTAQEEVALETKEPAGAPIAVCKTRSSMATVAPEAIVMDDAFWDSDYLARGAINVVGVWPTGYTQSLGAVLLETLRLLLPQAQPKPGLEAEAAYAALKTHLTELLQEAGPTYGVAAVVKLDSSGTREEWHQPCYDDLRDGEVLAVVVGTKAGMLLAATKKYWTCGDFGRVVVNEFCTCTMCTFFHFRCAICFKNPIRRDMVEVPMSVFTSHSAQKDQPSVS